MYTFRIGFGPSGNHYRDGKTWNVFRSVAHHTWARWMDIQWRQINHLRCLHSCDVQGGWDICSCHGVDSGHRVHNKCSSRCMSTHFMLTFFSLSTFLLVDFTSFTLPSRTCTVWFFSFCHRFGMHICWRFLMTTLPGFQLGATRSQTSFPSARSSESTGWSCQSTTQ